MDTSSPSMRREWIEIPCALSVILCSALSPSMRREWIEMRYGESGKVLRRESPSMRREWIEMRNKTGYHGKHLKVSLHAEGVD